MTHDTPPTPSELGEDVRGSLNRFVERYEPLRSELYRYCRHLTRSPWDAEDLAQDTLARAFVTLGRMQEAPPNPRAWLFRVASNLWLDRLRRTREVSGDVPEGVVPHEPRATREAAGTLIARLAPQERAAVVLKDVFEFSLEEVAEVLATTAGSIKAALHRARGKLTEPDPEARAQPAPGVLDAFCDAFNARDLDRLTTLLLDSASVEVVGASGEYGPTAARRGMLYGMLFGSERLAESDTRPGIEPRFKQGALGSSPRCELRRHRGETLMLLWYAHHDGEAVRAINRVEVDGDAIARIQNYFYTPDFLADVCGELNVPFRVNGYRHCLSS
jgi:RNA polymerase sigma-70 factor (ECF subfamily)